jgi:hypothetical protein
MSMMTTVGLGFALVCGLFCLVCVVGCGGMALGVLRRFFRGEARPEVEHADETAGRPPVPTSRG